MSALGVLPCAGWAQESAAGEGGATFSVGADVVSAYVWRGAYQAGVSVQPSLGVELAGVSLSSWGSVDLGYGGFKEVDFSLGYSIAGLSIAVTDYWWAGEGAYSYFSRSNAYDPADPNKKASDHLFEGTLAYTLPVEKLPLTLSWSTFFAGNDFKADDNGKVSRAFSTYIEASLPFTVKDVALDVALGVRPWESPAYQPATTFPNPDDPTEPTTPAYYSPELAVVNLSLKASKELKITDAFTLPVFGQVIFNPNAEDVFLVLGISF